MRRTGGDRELCTSTGRKLLVFGVRRNNPETFGMLVYRSSNPFSTNARGRQPERDGHLPGQMRGSDPGDVLEHEGERAARGV